MKPSLAEKLDDYLIRIFANFNYSKYVSLMNLTGNETILEIGCGGGNLSRFLSKSLSFGKLVCLENSDYWIHKAKKRLSSFNNIEFIFDDVLNFKRENYFDALVVHYVLHDLIMKEKAIEVLKKNLRENAKLFIREPTRKIHGMNSTEIEDLMISAGLEKLSSRKGYSFPLRGKVYNGVFVKK